MQNMLGASVDQLDALTSRLGTTAADIGTSSADTHTISNQVIDECQVAFRTAVSSITSSMEQMRASVEGAQAQLEASDWTGANRAFFDGAYGEFTTAMFALETTVNGAYSDFDAQMHALGGVMTDFQTQLAANLTDAQTSTTSMQQAVESQKSNLMTVMNTGMSFG